MGFLRLIIDNVFRSLLRTSLTMIATAILVLVVTCVWSILHFMQNATAEKSRNFKAIVTERWSIPSQMPPSYASSLAEGGKVDGSGTKPDDTMTWSFIGGSTVKEASMRTTKNSLFCFALDPEKLVTMMDDLDNLQGEEARQWRETVNKLKKNRQGIILGHDRLRDLGKQVGDKFTFYSFNDRGIELDVEVVGMFPRGRYDASAAVDKTYFTALLDQYAGKNGAPHPLAEKSLNLVWLKVPDTNTFTEVSDQISNSPLYKQPALKVESASNAIAAFLEGVKPILWLMQWILGPAILGTLALVMANAIGFNVRERRMEFAVMKVLGFQPWQILLIVMGEAMLVGIVASAGTAILIYYFVNNVMGGIPFPIAFFPKFRIPEVSILWGIGVGAGTALVGSFIPAWNACRVKVVDVFARVA